MKTKTMIIAYALIALAVAVYLCIPSKVHAAKSYASMVMAASESEWNDPATRIVVQNSLSYLFPDIEWTEAQSNKFWSASFWNMTSFRSSQNTNINVYVFCSSWQNLKRRYDVNYTPTLENINAVKAIWAGIPQLKGKMASYDPIGQLETWEIEYKPNDDI